MERQLRDVLGGGRSVRLLSRSSRADRLLAVLELRLTETTYLGADDYSIADIACDFWTLATTTFLKTPLADSLKTKPQVARWLNTVGERPIVQRGMQVPKPT